MLEHYYSTQIRFPLFTRPSDCKRAPSFLRRAYCLELVAALELPAPPAIPQYVPMVCGRLAPPSAQPAACTNTRRAGFELFGFGFGFGFAGEQPFNRHLTAALIAWGSPPKGGSPTTATALSASSARPRARRLSRARPRTAGGLVGGWAGGNRLFVRGEGRAGRAGCQA